MIDNSWILCYIADLSPQASILQVAAFLAGLFRARNIKCALIVAPKTLIAHWVKELKVVGLSRKTNE